MEYVFLVIVILGVVGFVVAGKNPEPIMKLFKAKTPGRAKGACLIISLLSMVFIIFMITPADMEPEKEVASTSQAEESNNSGLNLEWKTKDGYLASLSKELLDKAVEYAVQNDTQALDQMIKAEFVFPLKPGLTVILEEGSMFGSVVKIRAKGANFSLFTVREAITQ